MNGTFLTADTTTGPKASAYSGLDLLSEASFVPVLQGQIGSSPSENSLKVEKAAADAGWENAAIRHSHFATMLLLIPCPRIFIPCPRIVLVDNTFPPGERAVSP